MIEVRIFTGERYNEFMSLQKWIFDKICDYLMSDSGDPSHEYLCDFDRICHEIIPGDVLLIEGTNRVSNIIKNIIHSPWTHSALYVGRLHSIEDPQIRELLRRHYHGSAQKQLIVETIVGKGTEVHPIERYQHHHIRICRPAGIAHSDAQRVINFAIKRLGRTYNVRHILDLARFMLAGRWYIPRRWKSSLFTENPTPVAKDICSAMMAEAFMSVNFPILPLIRKTKIKEKDEVEFIHRNPKLFTPSDFDYSPFFSIIKYPIFSFTGPGPYHDLPWNNELLSNDDDVVLIRPKKSAEDQHND